MVLRDPRLVAGVFVAECPQGPIERCCRFEVLGLLREELHECVAVTSGAREDDVLLGRKVPEDGGGRDVAGLGDRVDRGAFEAMRREKPQALAFDRLPELCFLGLEAIFFVSRYSLFEVIDVALGGVSLRAPGRPRSAEGPQTIGLAVLQKSRHQPFLQTAPEAQGFDEDGDIVIVPVDTELDAIDHVAVACHDFGTD